MSSDNQVVLRPLTSPLALAGEGGRLLTSAEVPAPPAPFFKPTPGSAKRAALSLLDKLLLSIPEIAQLVGLSERQLRRLDSSGDIPGKVVHGRRVLFHTEVIRLWVQAGLPDRSHWTASLKGSSQR